MHDEFENLEAELTTLKPVELSPEKKAEILKVIAIESNSQPAEKDLEALEQELTALKPRSHSPMLKTAIAKETQRRAPRKTPPAWPILALAAAAILGVVLILPEAPTKDKPIQVETIPEEEPAEAPTIAETTHPGATENTPVSSPLAFSDPRAQAMVAAGYRPVSLEQMVLDTHDLGPDPEFQDTRQVRVKVLQAIKWNNRQTGVRVDTKQIHEAIIRRDASFH